MQLLVDGVQLFVRALQLFFGRVELFVRALQLLVARQDFFVGGLQFFVGGLELLDDRLQVFAAGGQFARLTRETLLFRVPARRRTCAACGAFCGAGISSNSISICSPRRVSGTTSRSTLSHSPLRESRFPRADGALFAARRLQRGAQREQQPAARHLQDVQVRLPDAASR